MLHIEIFKAVQFSLPLYTQPISTAYVIHNRIPVHVDRSYRDVVGETLVLRKIGSKFGRSRLMKKTWCECPQIIPMGLASDYVVHLSSLCISSP